MESARQGCTAVKTVDAREYKLLLNEKRFAGDARGAAEEYWQALPKAMGGLLLKQPAAAPGGRQRIRTVRFFDTPGSCLLNAAGYIFRERLERDGDREVMLKYRSPDRFIAACKEMQGRHKGAQTKFEEDIGAPFVSRYAHSTTQPIGAGKDLDKLKDLLDLYPGLKGEFPPQMPITAVSDLTITEVVFDKIEVNLGGEAAEFTLSLWYDSQRPDEPLLAEVSFKLEAEAERYREAALKGAWQLFHAMQQMEEWRATSVSTKSDFVYRYAGFCRR